MPVDPTVPTVLPATTAPPWPHGDPRQVRVIRPHSARVLDHDQVAVAAASQPANTTRPRPAAPTAVPAGAGIVHAGVEPVAARAEHVADAPAQGGDQPDRRARDRPGERAHGGGAGHAIGRQAGPCLEAAHRCLGVGAVAAVDRPGRKAVPGQGELERGHVPAGGPRPHRAGTERRPTAPAECRAGGRSPPRRPRRARCGPGSGSPPRACRDRPLRRSCRRRGRPRAAPPAAPRRRDAPRRPPRPALSSSTRNAAATAKTRNRSS